MPRSTRSVKTTRPTLEDVAQLAGVSLGTASKALSGGIGAERISDDCRRRVREASRALNYRPNYAGKALRSGRANAIGSLIAPDQLLFSQIAGGMARACDRLGMHLIILPHPGDLLGGAREAEMEGRIDALIVPEYFTFSPVREQLEEMSDRIPIVVAGWMKDTVHPCIGIDDAHGIRAAVQHLVSLGHKNLLWFGPDNPDYAYAVRREAAFHEASNEAGINSQSLLIAPPVPGELEAQISVARTAILQAETSFPFTGIVAYNEACAIGAMAALAEQGKRIPDNVSVIGFDDIHAGAVWPALTVVSHEAAKIGARCVEVAADLAAHPEKRAIMRGFREGIPAELVHRATTAAPKSGRGD